MTAIISHWNGYIGLKIVLVLESIFTILLTCQLFIPCLQKNGGLGGKSGNAKIYNNYQLKRLCRVNIFN